MDTESSTTDTFAIISDAQEPMDVERPDEAKMHIGQSNSALLDMFGELDKTISGPRLRELLEFVWAEGSLPISKIIWNARSIHIGKGDTETFYPCLEWLRVTHPETILTNLPWVFRSTIEKKLSKVAEGAPIIVRIATAQSEGQYDVLHGVFHGYSKDFLNILVLAVNGKLDILEDPRLEGFQGKHTLVASSIAEVLYPREAIGRQMTLGNPTFDVRLNPTDG
ncbi:MAG: hypothetical protein Q9187_007221 [Circinaria calcarea]